MPIDSFFLLLRYGFFSSATMNEDLLHYIWFQKQFPLSPTTTAGEPLEIIDIGQPNSDAGPDVFNAKVKIGTQLWCGNVEFHVNSSDWFRHGHETDKAYDSVILHVVFNADCEVKRTEKGLIPQWEIAVPTELATKYKAIQTCRQMPYCADKLSSIQEITIRHWLNRLLIERLERKVNAVDAILAQTTNNWEEAFYITLCRNFGFSTNADAFEQTAKSLPLTILGKHKDNLFQIESLLFGQAGWLDSEKKDDYVQSLAKEYRFLSQKYQLRQPMCIQWKFLRLRPANFPTVRMAQFAALVHKSNRLLSKLLECKNYQEIRSFFNISAGKYWDTHYTFGKESPKHVKSLSESSINIITINTVVPFLFAYGKKHGDETLQETALNLLESLPPERNHIVTKFRDLRLPAENAADTQAILQLKTNYCDAKKCLRCAIGCQLIKHR
ncbi:MAG: hypothetical protein BWX65_00974 [Bacteroidetes bacterium ADurb.Bin057]|nr:MAG: hypothetical protein BWX65_00974 [Bacteroidetes bacterium ADurb.Bin057]